MSVLIIGCSSFLGVNLLASLANSNYNIDRVSEHLGDKIPYDNLDKYRCIIYLKPDVNQWLLEHKPNVPMLAIGSGALVDYYAGRIESNSYIEGKQKLVQMSTVTLHPGFFIPSMTDLDTGRGLHRETLVNLFSEHPNIDLEKAYYMTPVSALIKMITMFIDEPVKYQGEYPIGSPMKIARKELLNGIVPNREAIYANDMKRALEDFGVAVTTENIKQFKSNAEQWVRNSCRS